MLRFISVSDSCMSYIMQTVHSDGSITFYQQTGQMKKMGFGTEYHIKMSY